MDRLSQVSSHLNPSHTGVVKLQQKHESDVVIVSAYRTAITKGGRGKFKDAATEDLLVGLVKATLEKLPHFDPALIEDVAIGNVLNPAAGAGAHRAALLAAGVPYTAPFVAVNRWCSSGLIAVNDIANKIYAGQIEIGLAGGVESMSTFYGPDIVPKFSDAILCHAEASKCSMTMGESNELLAETYGIDRAALDAYAAASFNKAERAFSQGFFKDEILPLQVEIEVESETDGEDGVMTTVTVDADEGPRKNVTAESLGKLRPAFDQHGTTTAGNASQVSDGAAIVLMMRRSIANKLKMPILAKYVVTAVCGVPPELMGVGPAVAIPKVLAQTGISGSEVAVFEINEAFAAQALYCIEHLGLDKAKVNPRGGAIALGHPLGATGARQIATIIRELKTGEIGVTSMCAATGIGAAAVFVKE
ncbi:hypothetical protein BABINDRAFT_162539 [Babjeviella inositovora NRRL Y-12698]|uniref:acetyl-CoA C-acyltransferase n=1 Tax=Babjeviella inositovora NRRL Y-12698 TaxID=984486 RepID=A0A1E3QMD7_9ASCO|nr:uncharacterized protein BABINDRAFT_162539 [Babjeviella inositovora NRRL Y-12698]ODQ78866.1 hypothetical protein BABINDRAFT_162539 [Babjeviella inositovora NRRL Y-12698]